MENQGKPLLLAVAIAFAVLLAWSAIFPPEEAKKPEVRANTPTENTAADTQPASDPDDQTVGDRPEAGQTALVTPTVLGPEQRFVFSFEQFTAEISSHGGSIRSWQLNHPQLRDRQAKAAKELIPFATKTSQARSFDALQLMLGSDSSVTIPQQAEWRGKKNSAHELVLVWENDILTVRKTYLFHPTRYAVELGIEITLKTTSGAKIAPSVSLFGYQDPALDTEGSMGQMPREWVASCFVDDEVKERPVRELTADAPFSWSGDVGWTGAMHSYFLAAIAPKEHAARRLTCTASEDKQKNGVMKMTLTYPQTELEPGDSLTETMLVYLGPKYLDLLENIAADIGYGQTLRESVDLGWVPFLSGPLLWLLKWFHGWVFNWGLAIILLTFVVKTVLLPWTHKSMKSMQGMSKLKPQLEKIKEKYKDDRQKQQLETMNLFKSQGVNPMAGCLPMLLQMPVWLALFQALRVAAELFQAEFLWVPDLTDTDPYFILPILLMGLMFLQTKISPTTATGSQQKMMMYGMPLMFGGMSFFFPAGLTVYICTNTILTTLHNVYIRQSQNQGSNAPDKSKPPTTTAAGNATDDTLATQTDRPATSRSSARNDAGSPSDTPRPRKGNKRQKKRRR